MPTCSIVPCWMLLHIGVELEDKRSSEARSHSTAIDSFYPLTMPVTVGPGSIAVAIGLGSQRPEGPLTLSQFALLGGSAIAGVVALTFTVYVCYRFAKRTTALLGENGVNVVLRLSAFILLCIVRLRGRPPCGERRTVADWQYG